MFSSTPKNILFCAAEAAPLIKVGGLADVVGSLPAALQGLGHDVRIIMPFYGSLRDRGIQGELVCGPIQVQALGTTHEIRVFQTALPPHQTPLYLLEWPEQFSGDAYDTKQDVKNLEEGVRRFILWSWAVAHVLPHLPWKVDFLHVHDWHAAAIPTFIQLLHQPCPPNLLTIHNLSIQGNWSPNEWAKWLDLNLAEQPLLALRDRHHDINTMQLGIQYCDAVSTVSPTYAKEILESQFSEGLGQDLQASSVTGIVNGIDTDVFNPATDQAIHAQYSIETVSEKKQLNRSSLRQQFGLEDTVQPLFGFIGRFTSQKGLDLLLAAAPNIISAGAQLLVLGSGTPELEQQLRDLQTHYPKAVRVIERFDAVLAQQMYAGLDALVMPSRFEPCGLGQLIAMRYGTIPIVADTGGLHDTIIDVRTQPETGTGYVVIRDSVTALVTAIEHFIEHHQDAGWYWNIVRRSMERDSSWYTSAQAYDRLYVTISQKNPTSIRTAR